MGFYIRDNGIDLFKGSSTNVISKYTLPSAWGVSTINSLSSVSSSSSLSYTGSPNRNSLEISSDGTKLYLISNYTISTTHYSKLYQFNMSTAWDISTLSTTPSVTYTLPQEGSSLRSKYSSLLFSSSGSSFKVLRLNLLDTTPLTYSHQLLEYTLSTNWTISSGVTLSSTLNINYLKEDFSSSYYNFSGGEILVNKSSGLALLPSISSPVSDSFLSDVDSFNGMKVYNNETLLFALNGCDEFNIFETNYTDTIPPTAPSNLEVSVSGSVATLTWLASTDNVGVTTYYPEVKIESNPWGIMAPVSHPTLTTTEGSLLSGGSYQFRIRAGDAEGNLSDYSNTVTIFT